MKRLLLIAGCAAMAGAQTVDSPRVTYVFHGPAPQRAIDESELIHLLHKDLAAQTQGINDQAVRRAIEHEMAKVQGDW